MKEVYVYNLLDNRKLILNGDIEAICYNLKIKREDIVECLAFDLRYGVALYFSNKPLRKYELERKMARPMLGFVD